jgi:hypothetical protein
LGLFLFYFNSKKISGRWFVGFPKLLDAGDFVKKKKPIATKNFTKKS